MCKACAAKNAERQVRLRAERYKAGRCAKCGQPKSRARAKMWNCQSCADAAALTSQAWRSARR